MRLFLGTGSNLGDRKQNLRRAAEYITVRIGRIVKASGIYQTQAWGIEDQPDFLNQVLEIVTDLPPELVLEKILQIEQEMGRKRLVKWRERLIDIDILFYDDLVIQTERMTIPHPFLQDRNFVLAPMTEIAPDFVHPVLQKRMGELLVFSKDKLLVKIIPE